MRKVTFVMRLFLASVIFWFAGMVGLQAQPDTWVSSFGSTLEDVPQDILVDDAGNAYVSGYFRDTLRFDGVTLASAGGNDCFLAKFDVSGQLLWAKRYGWHANDFAHGLAFDRLGNVLMVGEYQDSTIFETDTIYSFDSLWYGAPALTYDVFWLRVTPAGVMDTVWADGWFGSEHFYEVAVGADSLYYFAGMYRTYNYWTLPYSYDPRGWGRGYDDAIWVRSDAHGLMDHKAIVQGRYVDRASAIDLIGDSLVVMAGTFQDTCYFKDSTVYNVGTFDDDIWIACYSDTGLLKWHLTGGGKGINQITALVTDAAGNIFVSGTYDSLLIWGGSQLLGSGNLDGFVAMFDLDGNLQWLRKFGGSGYDVVKDLRLMGSGEILVTGYYQREMILDGGASLSLADTTDQNAYVAVITTTGSTRWVRDLGGSSPDVGVAVDEDASGHIYAVGTYSGTGQFGQVSVTSTGAEDVYVLRMNSDGAVFAADAQATVLGVVTAWPNPTADQLHLSFELQQNSDVSLAIMDLSGKVVQEQSYGRKPAGIVNIHCAVGDQPRGLYLYRLMAGGSSLVGKVVVVH